MLKWVDMGIKFDVNKSKYEKNAIIVFWYLTELPKNILPRKIY